MTHRERPISFTATGGVVQTGILEAGAGSSSRIFIGAVKVPSAGLVTRHQPSHNLTSCETGASGVEAMTRHLERRRP